MIITCNYHDDSDDDCDDNCDYHDKCDDDDNYDDFDDDITCLPGARGEGRHQTQVKAEMKLKFIVSVDLGFE